MPATVTQAIVASRGKYDYRAESDDACDAHFIECLVAVLDNNPNVGLAHCRSLRMDETSRIWGGRRQSNADRVECGKDVFSRIVLRNDIMGGNMMFTRAAHDEVGGFAVAPFESVCDYDFALRLCLKYDVAYVGNALGFHRVHRSNLGTKFQRTFDVEFFVREHYLLLSRAFEAARRQWGNMHELEKAALSTLTKTAGADAFLDALQSHNLCVAKELRAQFQVYDPTVNRSLYWFSTCIKRFAWRLFLPGRNRILGSYVIPNAALVV